MQKFLIAAIEALLFIGFILVAIRSWRARSANHTLLLPDLANHELTETPLAQSTGLYVATTEATDPNARVTASGLGHRGKARVLVYPFGLVILRKGEKDLLIVRDAITSIGAAEFAIDKGVENGGLVTIRWQNNNLSLATYLRFASLSERTAISAALQTFEREAI